MKDEGIYFNVLGKKVNVNKALDTVKSLGQGLLMNFNLFMGSNNVVSGRYQQSIEAVAGEFFNMKDLGIADGILITKAPDLIADQAREIKQSWLYAFM